MPSEQIMKIVNRMAKKVKEIEATREYAIKQAKLVILCLSDNSNCKTCRGDKNCSHYCESTCGLIGTCEKCSKEDTPVFNFTPYIQEENICGNCVDELANKIRSEM